jgi:vacuolar-type H+-ATPase subunit F/Vma7
VAKLTVITNPTLAPGFRLAGVEVIAAEDSARARQALIQLIDEGEAGIIAIDTPYLTALDYATARRIEEMVKPVVVSLPMGGPVLPEQRRSRQIAELIRRAIGIRMTFREEAAE